MAENSIKAWTLKAGTGANSIEISTDGSEEDHRPALEALALAIQKISPQVRSRN